MDSALVADSLCTVSYRLFLSQSLSRQVETGVKHAGEAKHASRVCTVEHSARFIDETVRFRTGIRLSPLEQLAYQRRNAEPRPQFRLT